jgi:hypothetical protein
MGTGIEDPEHGTLDRRRRKISISTTYGQAIANPKNFDVQGSSIYFILSDGFVLIKEVAEVCVSELITTKRNRVFT